MIEAFSRKKVKYKIRLLSRASYKLEVFGASLLVRNSYVMQLLFGFLLLLGFK